MIARRLYSVCDTTWPAKGTFSCGPVVLRIGDDGGKRVSAATCDTVPTPDDIERAEQEMTTMGQDHLFMIRDTDTALDDLLAARGYRVIDPVEMQIAACADIAALAGDAANIYRLWPPLAAQAEIWAEGGISSARLRVMDRVSGPKTAILIRSGDRPAGTAFVAIDGNIAMLHALEIAPWARRQGLANQIMGAAAIWAQNLGADQISVLVVAQNTSARALYASLRMKNVGSYHYRTK